MIYYFSHEKSFDWYVGWKELKEKFLPFLNQDDKILMVGCGNSSNLIYI